MPRPFRALVVTAVVVASGISTRAAGEAKLAVGIVPFDAATVAGGSGASGETIAKLVRIEMIKNVKLQPTLLPAAPPGGPIRVPAGQKPDIILIGTVLNADTTASSRSANTGSLLGSGVGVGGRVTRVTTEVGIHLELVKPDSGNIVDSFDVETKSSGTKLGTDLSTALGSFESDGSAFDSSSIGKAFREAAQKIAAEVAKRADKFK